MKYPAGTRVLMWRLDEDVPQLMGLCREAGISCDELEKLPMKRQREKVAERLLLFHAFGRTITLEYTEQGAPYINGLDVNISISHTPRLVALALSEEHVIGIDAEQMDREQVLRVRDKFLNDKEKQFIAPEDRAAHIIAWTAKEAIIKAERNSALDWTEGIGLEPFTVKDEEVTFAARCGDNRYCLTTRCVEGHYLTLATPTCR
ncbi:MAG: 4'-phosphopantetheinyl transferase superfamily protein [Muribaculaceae bacterium]|nr:4'-phosphopantetheinyl transferase superfamily protein [Muribaculaceae bacterium]